MNLTPKQTAPTPHSFAHSKPEFQPYVGNFESYGNNESKFDLNKYPTLLQDLPLVGAFNYFNRELFNATLTQPLLRFSTRGGPIGFYKPAGWIHNRQQNMYAEINLNEKLLNGEVLDLTSKLTYLMVFHQYSSLGFKITPGYFTQQLANLMRMVGLICLASRESGGMQVNQFIIDPEGAFVSAFEQMPEHCIVPLRPILEKHAKNAAPMNIAEVEQAEKSDGKTKFVCPTPKCDTTVWGKPSSNILCGKCIKQMVAHIKPGMKMIAKEPNDS
jgi:hypothetical protein